MSKSLVLRCVGMAAALFGIAGWSAYYYDYSAAKTLRMFLGFGIGVLALIGTAWFLDHSFGYREDESTRDAGSMPAELEELPGTPAATVAIYVSILALAGIWVIGALSKLYSPKVPLIFFIAGVGSFVVIEAADEIGVQVRTKMSEPGTKEIHWQWVVLSSVAGGALVAIVYACWFDLFRTYRWVSPLCASICFVIVSCAVYRFGLARRQGAK